MKRMNETNEMEAMEKELWEVLNTTDYSTCELASIYCKENNILIIPKPLMALVLVDENIRKELANEVLQHPNCLIVVV